MTNYDFLEEQKRKMGKNPYQSFNSKPYKGKEDDFEGTENKPEKKLVMVGVRKKGEKYFKKIFSEDYQGEKK